MSISLCVIARDESKLLEEFLSYHKELFDEIIIVDTGSTDDTIEIARKFTDKIYTFRWNDDFSAARNFSISKASSDWILWLDPDEQIDRKDFEKIIKLVKNKEFLGYRFIQETYLDGKLLFTKGICKLFQNDKEISFVYPVHETVRESIKRSGGMIGKTGIVIKHNPKFSREKSEYYMKLIEKKGKEFPSSNWKKEEENESYAGEPDV